jgi:hypothetical protein
MSFNIFNEKRKEILNLMEMDELKKYFVNI